MDKKHGPHVWCLLETHHRSKDLQRLKVNGWKEIFQSNGQEKRKRKARVAIKRNPKRSTARHIIIQMPSFKDKERILKAAMGK